MANHLIEEKDLPQDLRGQNIKAVIRTRQGCYGLKESPMWGRRLTMVPDPQAIEITKDDLDRLELPDSYTKVPKEIWSRVVLLFFHFCDPDNKTVDQVTEASVRFTRRWDDPSKWRCWVPRQEVGAGSVHARFDNGMIDIVTGEEIKDWPLEGEFDAGSAHSHNTMSSFFSGTDDTNELPCPGFHAVVGNINLKDRKYVVLGSVVLDKKRFILDADSLIDCEPVHEAEFHPKVLDYIKRYQPKVYSGGGGGSSWMGARGEKTIVTWENGIRREYVLKDDEKNTSGGERSTRDAQPTAGGGQGQSGDSKPFYQRDLRAVAASKMSAKAVEGQMRSASVRLSVLLERMVESEEGRAMALRVIREVFQKTDQVAQETAGN